MPISQNPKECGWFYHAPAKREPGKQRVDYPAPSNIPGIGFDDPALMQREPVKEMVFRETDSEYIRLAKMGGRKDLLSFNPDRFRKKKTAEASFYPRNDWFYLEDNRIEDEERKTEEIKDWQFLLPDYMVHRSYKPSFEDPRARPTRSAAPYYTDATSVMKDEGRSATDKTVKIAEHRRPGYGVRNQKDPPVTQKLPPRETAIKPQDSEALHVETKRIRPQFHMPTEREEPTSMSKLLAGGYENQWCTKMTEMKQQQQQRRYSSDDELPQSTIEPGGMQAPYGHQRLDRAELPPNGVQRKRTDDEEEKELFKLNRFKNIPSKLDPYQRPDLLTSVK